MGYGPIFQDDPDLKGIIDNANTAKAISEAAKVAGFPLDAVQDLVGSFDFFSDKIQNPDSVKTVGNEQHVMLTFRHTGSPHLTHTKSTGISQ